VRSSHDTAPKRLPPAYVASNRPVRAFDSQPPSGSWTTTRALGDEPRTGWLHRGAHP
jgi:hypothetical protein